MSDKFWHKDQDRGMIGGGASLIAGAAGSSVCGICFSDYGKCEHSKVSTGGQGGAGHDPSNYGKVVVDDKCYSHKMIKALIAERDNALAQNAELMAQVEALLKSAQVVVSVRAESSEIDPLDKELTDAMYFLEDTIKATPIQHLRDRDAAGFVAGVQYAHKRPDVVLPKVIEMVACDYAEKVRRGEV